MVEPVHAGFTSPQLSGPSCTEAALTLSSHEPLALALGAAVGVAAGLYAALAVDRARSSVGWPRFARRGLLAVAASGIGGILGLLIGARFELRAELPAFLLLLAVAVPLSAIDLAVRTVPDRLLLPAIAAS